MSGFSKEQLEQLASDLDAKHVKSRTQGGTKVSYIEGWHAMSECNRIFGFDRWEYRIDRLEETNRDLVDVEKDEWVNGQRTGNKITVKQWRVGYLCSVVVTVDANGTRISRPGAGFGEGIAKPEALGSAIESAAKEAETDALKRALRSFGPKFGLALYDKEKKQVSVGADDVETKQQREEAEVRLRAEMEDWTARFCKKIQDCETIDGVDALWGRYWEPSISRLPKPLLDTCDEQRKAAKERLTGITPPTPPQRVNGEAAHA